MANRILRAVYEVGLMAGISIMGSESLNEDPFFGYKFGYRHQFALISVNSAKLRS
jgi:hypothetical protein